MLAEYITELADTIGSLLESLFLFLYSLTAGYIIIMSVVFVGMILVLYFRFFRSQIERIGKEMHD